MVLLLAFYQLNWAALMKNIVVLVYDGDIQLAACGPNLAPGMLSRGPWNAFHIPMKKKYNICIYIYIFVIILQINVNIC